MGDGVSSRTHKAMLANGVGPYSSKDAERYRQQQNSPMGTPVQPQVKPAQTMSVGRETQSVSEQSIRNQMAAKKRAEALAKIQGENNVRTQNVAFEKNKQAYLAANPVRDPPQKSMWDNAYDKAYDTVTNW